MNELLAVFLSSLAGSWHCAGMCGPLAYLAIGEPGKSSAFNPVIYHLSRLASYALVVVSLKVLGWPLYQWLATFKKEWVLIWSLYILVVVWAFMLWFSWQPKVKLPSFLVRFNRRVLNAWPFLAPLALGATTGLLPCLWLYGFFIFALTKTSFGDSLLVISVFWLGTIPGLLVSQKLLQQFRWPLLRRAVPLVFVASLGILIMRSPLRSPDTCLFHKEKPSLNGHSHKMPNEVGDAAGKATHHHHP